MAKGKGEEEARCTWERFLKASLELVTLAPPLRWTLLGDKEIPGGAYLVLRDVIPDVMPSPNETSLEDAEEEMASDLSTTLPQPTSNAIWREFHIVYSLSYAVPVLYFNMGRCNGSLLTLQEIWQRVPTSLSPEVNENPWTTITQQEHPALGRPFFQLHPCRTANLLAQVTSQLKPRNLLLTWLSTVGPTVGLQLPMNIATGAPASN